MGVGLAKESNRDRGALSKGAPGRSSPVTCGGLTQTINLEALTWLQLLQPSQAFAGIDAALRVTNHIDVCLPSAFSEKSAKKRQ
jgi:hypothetical protein